MPKPKKEDWNKLKNLEVGTAGPHNRKPVRFENYANTVRVNAIANHHRKKPLLVNPNLEIALYQNGRLVRTMKMKEILAIAIEHTRFLPHS